MVPGVLTAAELAGYIILFFVMLPAIGWVFGNLLWLSEMLLHKLSGDERRFQETKASWWREDPDPPHKRIPGKPEYKGAPEDD